MVRMNASPRSGFTLVELLVVITIIGILAALGTYAVQAARKRAHQTRISVELMNLDQAMKSYSARYGDYPPDFSDPAAVNAHILRCFPRCSAVERTLIVNNAFGLSANPVTPAEAIVFWLGGLSADPQAPFTGLGGPLYTPPAGATNQRTPLYEFNSTRLVQRAGTSFFTYLAPAGNPPLPYVYFDSHSYMKFTPAMAPTGGAVPGPPNAMARYAPTGGGIAKPFRSDSAQDNYWMNPRTCQIISAGLDGNYGTNNTIYSFPSLSGLSKADKDNQTNFTGGGVLSTK